MPTNPELEQLLQDRFDITTTDFVVAFKVPSRLPAVGRLSH